MKCAQVIDVFVVFSLRACLENLYRFRLPPPTLKPCLVSASGSMLVGGRVPRFPQCETYPLGVQFEILLELHV